MWAASKARSVSSSSGSRARSRNGPAAPPRLRRLGVILVWVVTGPVFHYSDTWQLVINTGTTIVTFLMVFLIQRAQNKESLAVQLKLNELVAAMEGASNRLIDVEDLTEEELMTLHRSIASSSHGAEGRQRSRRRTRSKRPRYRHARKARTGNSASGRK